MNSVKRTRFLQHCIYSLSGMGASLLFFYFTLLQLSNAIAIQRPDGFPLDSEWKICGGLILSLLLAIAALIVSPSEEDGIEC